ncbi:hypothetical protein LTR10_005809 [Elasticomyces elasticus]|nr:hypothetical protein LTR10_005809 [Elasticomyces elasticus]KAK4965016.1 hypothetical protein LTR42_012434 [Elasticomyces elasticus]
MATAEIVDVDPRGDAILLCGEHVGDKKITGLRVCSHILSYGTPVFRSLLAPRFREGTTLATTSSVEIPLPEDDPHHMAVLCNILHMRHEWEPYSVHSPATLAEFAVLCDKYDCALVVKPTLERYILADLHTATAQVTGKYLAVAFMLRYTNLVGKIGERLVFQLDRPTSHVVDTKSVELSALCAGIDNLVYEAQRKVRNFIDGEIQRLLPGRTMFEACDATCTAQMLRITSFLEQPSTYHLWPAGSGKINLESMLRSMESVRFHDPMNMAICSAGLQCAKNLYEDCDLRARTTAFRLTAMRIRKEMGKVDASLTGATK